MAAAERLSRIPDGDGAKRKDKTQERLLGRP